MAHGGIYSAAARPFSISVTHPSPPFVRSSPPAPAAHAACDVPPSVPCARNRRRGRPLCCPGPSRRSASSRYPCPAPSAHSPRAGTAGPRRSRPSARRRFLHERPRPIRWAIRLPEAAQHALRSVLTRLADDQRHFERVVVTGITNERCSHSLPGCAHHLHRPRPLSAMDLLASAFSSASSSAAAP